MIDEFEERILYAYGDIITDPINVEQGSEDWQIMRLGVPSASNAEKILNTNRKGDDLGETAKAYVYQLCGEVMTKEKHSIPSNNAMNWGVEFESEARDRINTEYHYEGETEAVFEFPFIPCQSSFFGASPDGLCFGNVFHNGIEIKCPYNSSEHVKHILNGKEGIKKEYISQVLFSMYVTGLDWDFYTYDPRNTVIDLHSTTFRAKDYKEELKEIHMKAERFKNYYIAQLKELGLNYGDQWKEKF